MKLKIFVINGFTKSGRPLITDNQHRFVLGDRKDNFFNTPAVGFPYHRWAASLKSSQAFAHNVFSGIKGEKDLFEFHMRVFDRDAQVDIKLENKESKTIELFEVKAFEICNIGTNTIKFAEKYDDLNQYIRKDIANKYFKFKEDVLKEFEGQRIYGGGIKQLCSHLLGIINIVNDHQYTNTKFKLYSFCFDYHFSDKFKLYLENYKSATTTFKRLADSFLKDINENERIEYCGFLSAKEYIEKNKIMLGENYEYVMNRYFKNRVQ